MTNLIISFIGWKLYLYADAYQDADHQKKYGTFSHKTNFWNRFVVGAILTVQTWPFFHAIIPLVAFGFWLIALGWFFFELFHNKLTDQADWKHVGSGGIDLWFKEKYPLTFKDKLFFTKMLFIGITTTLFIWSLITYHII